MLFLYLLLLVVHAVLIFCVLSMCKVKWKEYLAVIACLPIILWALYNPLFTVRPEIELSHRKVRLEDGSNWANTFVFTPSATSTPSTVAELQDIITSSDNVRVVGGGHSWVPLIATTGTLISLDKFDSIDVRNTTVVVGSGVTLQQLSDALEEHGKMFRGFGSVKKQTVGGGFSTSLHGNMPDGFSKHVVSLKAVDGSGKLVETSDMRLWRDSMGLLGVIYEFTIATHDLEYVDVTVRDGTIQDVLALLQARAYFDAVTIASGPSDFDEISWKVRRAVVRNESSKDATKRNQIDGQTRESFFFYDYFLLPQIVLASGFISLFDLTPLFIIEQDHTNVAVTNAWNHPEEFGFDHSEYAIPLENCTKAFEELFTAVPKPASFEFRFSEASDHCLSWSPQDACALGMSVINIDLWTSDFYKTAEKIALKYGGIAHLGKHFAGEVSSQMAAVPCFGEFNATRASLDPEDKFVNAFAREMIYGEDRSGERYIDKSGRRLVYTFVTVIVYSALLLFCICERESSGRTARKNGYSRVLAGDL